MPMFEYQCKKCGHVTEFLESTGSSKKKHVCQKCGSTELEKLFSAFSARVASGSTPTGSSSCPTGTCPLS